MQHFRRISIAIVLAALLCAGPALVAQTTTAPDSSAPGMPGPKGGHHRRGAGFDKLEQQLNLTDAQKQQLQSLRSQQKSQLQAVQQNSSLTAEQKHEQLQQLHKSFHGQMMGILTPDQQTQLKQLRAQAGEKMQQHFAQALNLTPDQQSKLQPLFQQQREQMQALHNDTSLTPDQRKAKAQQLHQDFQAQLNGILTPEQQQQLQQMRGHRRHRGGAGFGPGGPSPNPTAL